MAKKYDLVVKVGEYTDGQGQTKGRFKNVGVMMEGNNGPYILLDRTFNPAGVGGNDGRESIIISMYEPKQEGQQSQSGYNSPAPSRPQPNPAALQPRDLDDEVPF
jgi:hypothetical protein